MCVVITVELNSRVQCFSFTYVLTVLHRSLGTFMKKKDQLLDMPNLSCCGLPKYAMQGLLYLEYHSKYAVADLAMVPRVPWNPPFA